MEYQITTENPSALTTDCLAFLVHGKASPRLLEKHSLLAEIDAGCQGLLSRALDNGDLRATAGNSLMLPLPEGSPAARLLLVHTGSGKVTPTKARSALSAMAACLRDMGAEAALCCLSSVRLKGRNHRWLVEQAVYAINNACYRFVEFKSKKGTPPTLRSVSFAVPEESAETRRQAMVKAQGIAAGISFMRDLCNRPANHCPPSYLAQSAEELAAADDQMDCHKLSEDEMRELGMGSFLSVTAGSRQPAYMIVLEYKGAAEEDKPIVLVGKGITFDTGGISIKPSANMGKMKYDMSGAGSILGVFQTLSELKPNLNVVGILAAAENMPDGAASRPGDIVTSMSGKTIEILNTDAEGRLVLCDALTYAERYEPAYLVDIATLTGACMIALGNQAAGLYANDEKLAKALLAAGDRSHDRAWRMPLWADYQKQLSSGCADMANIGGPMAGSVTAACFLARFTAKQRWAHLDIAGVAWGSGDKGSSTGRPVRLLMEFLLSQAS